jgi:hypothetical protein
MQHTAHGRAHTPAEQRHATYLDALAAFGLTSGLFMEDDGSDDGSGGDAGGQGTDGATSTGSSDKGFPDGTPLEEMTAEQQAAYWKDKARKHETRVKSLGNLSADELAALREKANRHDALEFELMSDKDKAVAEAKESASTEARSTWLPRVVAAEFKAAAAGRIESDRLAAILEPLDLSKFIDGDDVDAEKVAAFVDDIAPKQDQQPAPRRGPSASTAGQRTSTTAPSIDNGRSEYQRRHGRKSA